MPVNNGLDAAQAKRNRLPFKPPRRQSSGIEGSSKTTSRKKTSSSTATTSKTKAARKPSSSKTATTNSRKRKAQSLPDESESASDDDENDARINDGESLATSRSGSPLQEPDYILAEIVTNDRPRDIESGQPGIPPKLLTRLLHHHFQNPKTKITKDANEVVAKYIDIFVREALARAAYERAEGNAANGDGAGRSVADGFLEVRCSFLTISWREDFFYHDVCDVLSADMRS
jgi:CENP-S associating Centromere protein X